MANKLYEKGRQKFLDGQISWTSDTIIAILIDLNAYTPDFANNEFLSDVPALARIAVSGGLASKTSVGGVADSADVTWPTVSGPQSEAVLLVKNTGTDSTSPLIGLLDTATGIPVLPNGGNITVQWDNGPNKIFKL